jgi:putative heme-binding domain-containing protein
MAGELLVYLKMPGIIESSIPLLAEDSTQYQQLRMARMLMHLREGWTEDTKTAFLNWLLQSRRMTGGRQLNERLTDIRTDFYELLTEGDKSTHARLIEKIEQPIESGELTTSRPLVQQWKMEDLTKDISAVSSNRPDEDGLRALTAANCLKCHKVGNRGGQIGPDLTNVAKRFNASQILESIIEPSKEVDPKYSYSVYLLIDGTSVSGRPVGVTSKTLKLEINPFTQESIEINRDEIDESFPGKTSPMPSGLLDTLNKEEIKDLLAYLIRAAAQ